MTRHRAQKPRGRRWHRRTASGGPGLQPAGPPRDGDPTERLRSV